MSRFISRLKKGRSALLALLTAGTAPQIFAQQAADEPVGEVVVTGYRAAIESAVEAKRESNGMVDVIKSDDIASFPDANLAEAVQRIPGVSIDRDSGELGWLRLSGRSSVVCGLVAAMPGPVCATYEAGPTGFALTRRLEAAGVDCLVCAAGLIVRGPSDRVTPIGAMPSGWCGC